MRVSVEERFRFESSEGLAAHPEVADGYGLNRLRISTQFRLPQRFSLTLQAQDARAFGYKITPCPASLQDSFDLRTAYLDYGDIEGSAVRMRLGRQPLVFGEGRLVADPEWGNGRVFDAVRSTVRRKGLALDAFAASVVSPTDGHWNRHVDGNNFHGIYSVFDRLVPKGTVEFYGFWRLDPAVKSEAGSGGKLDAKTYGVRVAGKLTSSYDYTAEMAMQRGSLATDVVRAWAGHWAAGRTLSKARWQPRIFSEYGYATGDNAQKDGIQGAFDQLYPSAHDKAGLADQYMWRNNHHVRAALELNPNRKWKVASGYHSVWLASLADGIYRGGKLLVRQANNTNRHVSQELDVQAFWSFKANTRLNFGYAYIVPGAFLNAAKPSITRQFAFFQVAQRF
jgi:hypothetical protein